MSDLDRVALDRAVFGASTDAPAEVVTDTIGLGDDGILRYRPNSEWQRAFHTNGAKHRLQVGPFGCGKTYASIWEMYLVVRGDVQCLCSDGVIRARILAVRNTYPQLRATTIKTFHRVFPVGKCSVWNEGRKEALIDIAVPGEPRVMIEVLFRALDRPEDYSSLLSAEYTHVFFNELSEIEEEIYNFAVGRLGRYPDRTYLGEGKALPIGRAWSDTNPTDYDHWIYPRWVGRPAKNHALIHYPPADRPEGAVNQENVSADYYGDQMAGNSEEWKNRYLRGKFGALKKPGAIFTSFAESLHCISGDDLDDPARDKWAGVDYGMTPVVVFWDKDAAGRWIAVGEVGGARMTLAEFGPVVSNYVMSRGWGRGPAKVHFIGDPSGEYSSERSQRTGDTASALLEASLTIENFDVRD